VVHSILLSVSQLRNNFCLGHFQKLRPSSHVFAAVDFLLVKYCRYFYTGVICCPSSCKMVCMFLSAVLYGHMLTVDNVNVFAVLYLAVIKISVENIFGKI
jgi:hypothetical protein